MNDIEIIDYFPYKSKDGQVSSLKGFLKFKIKTPFGMLTCVDCKLFGKNGQHWVSFPAKKIEKDGAPAEYWDYSRFEKDDSDKFSKSVVDALRTFKKPETTSGSSNTKISAHSSNNMPLKCTVISMNPTTFEEANDLPF